MDALNVNSILVNNYLALLQNMSQDHKLELLAKLAQSLKTEKEEGMSMKEEKKRIEGILAAILIMKILP